MAPHPNRTAFEITRYSVLAGAAGLIYYSGNSVKADPWLHFKLVFAGWLLGNAAYLRAKQFETA